jgi:hypothetical protein
VFLGAGFWLLVVVAGYGFQVVFTVCSMSGSGFVTSVKSERKTY